MTIDIKKLKDILEDEEIVEEKDLERLKELKNKIGFDRVAFAKLFLETFDILGNNLYLFGNEEENVKKYLSEFNVAEIRNLLEQYKDGGIGTYFQKMKIQNLVNDYREKFNSLIQIFFKLVGGEE